MDLRKLLFLLFLSYISFAQEGLKVSYTMNYQKQIDNPARYDVYWKLYATPNQSLFVEDKLLSRLPYNPETLEYQDRPKSGTPTFRFWIHKTDKIITYSESRGTTEYYGVESPIMTIDQWDIKNDTMSIAGLLCNSAQTTLEGRKWKVWFTPEISLNNGPYKFSGLPGLIIKAESEDGEYNIYATKIEEFKHQIPLPEFQKVSQKKLLELRQQYIDNPQAGLGEATVNVKYQGKVYNKEEWNKVLRESILKNNSIDKVP